MLNFTFPTMDGASTVMTRLISRCAESSLTPFAWLASMALIRNGAIKMTRVLVMTSSISASVVFPPACLTRVCPCARVDGPMAKTVRPAQPAMLKLQGACGCDGALKRLGVS